MLALDASNKSLKSIQVGETGSPDLIYLGLRRFVEKPDNIILDLTLKAFRTLTSLQLSLDLHLYFADDSPHDTWENIKLPQILAAAVNL